MIAKEASHLAVQRTDARERGGKDRLHSARCGDAKRGARLVCYDIIA